MSIIKISSSSVEATMTVVVFTYIFELLLMSLVGPSVHFNERAFLDPADFNNTDLAMKEYYRVMIGKSSKHIFRVRTCGQFFLMFSPSDNKLSASAIPIFFRASASLAGLHMRT